ncbi:8-oxo-dGTP pyrophosphatase MutT (NUDIX family) [Peribacillus deserti]|uniref:8-oxo-dGTP pyrophosphatase MutT (NUDIX family) n=1 Tax=Peribacillus deserti TaxID=673318 RepID=A0ABS2QG85_9BACI|nr:NUDIX hydrolase [Peribacillus deserti]MBM7692176.1 8-oxo-dGTP pyrophosphatase MutT (NUDIX family) [Peribacillus deserti]
MKQVSAALFLTDGEKFLVCHATGGKHYDLPKGLIDEGEEAIIACIRETKEETGLVLTEGDLVDLGIFPYTSKKNLHIFLCIKEPLPITSSFTCTSTFVHYYTKKDVPEVDGYMYISYSDKEKYVTSNMNKTLEEVIKKITES